MTHTPGPWITDKRQKDMIFIGPASDLDQYLAEVWASKEGAETTPEDDANAQLIACAPEMGKMLLSIFSHVSHGGPTREQGEALLKKAGLIE